MPIPRIKIFSEKFCTSQSLKVHARKVSPEIMNTNNTIAAAKIQLNETFTRLLSGAATMADVVTERAAVRAAMLAGETTFTRRRREFAEAYETFAVNCAY
jgi:hypothetical protein